MSESNNKERSARKYCSEHKDACADPDCVFAYDESKTPEQFRWRGEGPPPASWYAPDGTKVYRSYADYCDD